MTPEPFYRPMKRGARIFWTLVTLAASAYLFHGYASALAAL